MTNQEIKNIIEKGENIQTEFKTSRTKLPNNLFETICAFLNTKGGIILLGVNDNGKIIGIDNSSVAQLKKDIANLSNNPEKLSPIYFLQINEFDIEGKKIILRKLCITRQYVTPMKNNRGELAKFNMTNLGYAKIVVL